MAVITYLPQANFLKQRTHFAIVDSSKSPSKADGIWLGIDLGTQSVRAMAVSAEGAEK